MPRLVRFYIRHTLIGFAVAVAFVALLLAFDVGHLRHLILTSDVGALALFLLVFFNGIVFSGVQFGIAVMRLGDGDGPRRGRPVRPGRGIGHAVPVAVDRPAR